jgi:hypothetical protein
VSATTTPRFRRGSAPRRPLVARVNDADAARLEAILDRSSLRTNDMRSSYDKSGWKGFDPKAKPYSADEVRQYRSSWQ